MWTPAPYLTLHMVIYAAILVIMWAQYAALDSTLGFATFFGAFSVPLMNPLWRTMKGKA
eukprot:4362217-Amphidinium_carterae.1